MESCGEDNKGFNICLSHLLVLGSFRFDGQDQIGRGVPQLADVLVDVVLPLHHVVVHVPVVEGE